MTTEEKPVISG